MLAAQVAGLIAVGVIIGVVDGRAWKAPLERPAAPPPPPPVDRTPGSSNGGTSAQQGQPRSNGAGQQGRDVAPPTPPPPVAAAELKPGDPGWKPIERGNPALKAGQITLAEARDQQQFQLATFLDARSKEEFAAGHIPGAHLAPLSAFRANEPPAVLATLQKDWPIIIYCAGGDCEASEDVAMLLQQAGHTQVSVIHDGFPGWKAVGYPVEVGEPKP